MFVHRKFDASSMRMIYAVIFIFYICNVRSDGTSELSTDTTPVVLTNDASDVSASSASGETDTTKSAGTTSPIISEASSQQTPISSGSTLSNIITTPISGTSPIESSSGLPPNNITDIVSTVTSSSNFPITDITPTITGLTPCPPGKFPFVDTCIEAAENGGVVITAFILSVISFIGIIGAASYVLFFRKYFSHKKNRIVANYNVPSQEMRTSTVTDNKPSTLSPPKTQRRNSQGTLIKKNLNPNQTSKDTTIIIDSRPGQKTNVLDKQPSANNAKIKQRKQEHHSIHLDDNQF